MSGQLCSGYVRSLSEEPPPLTMLALYREASPRRLGFNSEAVQRLWLFTTSSAVAAAAVTMIRCHNDRLRLLKSAIHSVDSCRSSSVFYESLKRLRRPLPQLRVPLRLVAISLEPRVCMCACVCMIAEFCITMDGSSRDIIVCGPRRAPRTVSQC